MKNSLLYDKVFGLDIIFVPPNLAHPSNRMRYDDAFFIAGCQANITSIEHFIYKCSFIRFYMNSNKLPRYIISTCMQS